MKFNALVISGTRCSGKSTCVSKLLVFDNRFFLVKAATTRPAREALDAINYYHITDEDFDKRDFFIKTQYGDFKYGIEKIEVQKVIKEKKIPVLIVSPESFLQFPIDKNADFLSFFLDADDEVLIKRLIESRGSDKKILEIETKNRTKDRSFSHNFIYRVNNSFSSFDEDLCKLIVKLWEHRNSGGLIPKSFISLLTKFDILLKGADEKNIASASYDLSLGDEYYYKGKIKTLSNKNPFIMIEPYDYAIVTSAEYASLPNDIAGKFDLKISLFCQGIILSNGPQVDPGFQGKLFCLLFNTSNSAVVIKRNEHYATLEFNKLVEATDGYIGKYQSKSSIINYLPSNTLQGGLNELKKEVEKLKNESIKLQTTILGIISLLLAIIALFRALN
ncbi:MAG: hypothetical protein M3O71_21645 [Bacteroidota bacterium]|nr:hypothetical protein [Bacteroidota bacterium]